MRTALADQGNGTLDVHVIECAVAGGYGGDAAAADAVTAWIAETLRRGVPKGERRAGIPRVPAASEAGTRSAGWCADGSDVGYPRGRDHPPQPLADDAHPRTRRRVRSRRHRSRRRATRLNERLTLPPTERNRPSGRQPRPRPGRSSSNAALKGTVTVTHGRVPERPSAPEDDP